MPKRTIITVTVALTDSDKDYASALSMAIRQKLEEDDQQGQVRIALLRVP